MTDKDVLNWPLSKINEIEDSNQLTVIRKCLTVFRSRILSAIKDMIKRSNVGPDDAAHFQMDVLTMFIHDLPANDPVSLKVSEVSQLSIDVVKSGVLEVLSKAAQDKNVANFRELIACYYSAELAQLVMELQDATSSKPNFNAEVVLESEVKLTQEIQGVAAIFNIDQSELMQEIRNLLPADSRLPETSQPESAASKRWPSFFRRQKPKPNVLDWPLSKMNEITDSKKLGIIYGIIANQYSDLENFDNSTLPEDVQTFRDLIIHYYAQQLAELNSALETRLERKSEDPAHAIDVQHDVHFLETELIQQLQDIAAVFKIESSELIKEVIDKAQPERELDQKKESGLFKKRRR